MRLTDSQVEMILGCTPCVCGDLEGWHFACYRGLSQQQIDAKYKLAFAKARREIKRRAMQIAGNVAKRDPTPAAHKPGRT